MFLAVFVACQARVPRIHPHVCIYIYIHIQKMWIYIYIYIHTCEIWGKIPREFKQGAKTADHVSLPLITRSTSKFNPAPPMAYALEPSKPKQP